MRGTPGDREQAELPLLRIQAWPDGGLLIKRLFIASRIHEPAVLREIEDAWERALELLPAGTAAERENQPHITMCFLGDMDTAGAENQDRLDELQNRLGRIAARRERIPLILGHLHTFPGILWASVGGTGEAVNGLDSLRQQVRDEVKLLEKRGLSIQPGRHHPWLPHITLGAFDETAGEELRMELRTAEYPTQEGFHVEQIELLESRSRMDGSREYLPAAPPAELR